MGSLAIQPRPKKFLSPWTIDLQANFCGTPQKLTIPPYYNGRDV
jgi:hypothetical protein